MSIHTIYVFKARQIWTTILVGGRQREYLVDGYPCVCKDDHQPSNLKTSEYVVLKVVKSYLNKGRNVTCHNFFTSIGLAKELKKYNISLVSTVHKTHREIPKQIKNMSQARTLLT